jgi:hypothetical protein
MLHWLELLIFLNSERMVNRNSWGYTAGKALAKVTILVIGFLIGKKYTQRPIDKGYPKNPTPKK